MAVSVQVRRCHGVDVEGKKGLRSSCSSEVAPPPAGACGVADSHRGCAGAFHRSHLKTIDRPSALPTVVGGACPHLTFRSGDSSQWFSYGGVDGSGPELSDSSLHLLAAGRHRIRLRSRPSCRHKPLPGSRTSRRRRSDPADKRHRSACLCRGRLLLRHLQRLLSQRL